MKTFLITALTAITMNVFVLPAAYAQDEEFDTELLEESEELPPPNNLDTPPPETSENSNNSSESPNRFRPAPRFGGGRFGAPTRGSDAPSSTTSSTFSSGSTNSGNNTSSTKPIGTGKVSLADAQPEDINNKNFPDIVESFDYKDAPIADVVNAIGRLTGKNFIFEQNLTGKITIMAPRKVTVAEAWQAFLSALSMNGMTVVPAGKFLKIRKIDDAKSDSIETYAGAYYPNGDQLITRIVRLKYINADDVQKTFQNVIKSKQGQMAAYEKTNSLIITDLGSNIERIMLVLEELDKPGFEEQLKVITIKNAKAKDIAELITKIINKGENKNQNTFRPASRFGEKDKDESLSLVSPDERTNSIIVVGNSQGIARIVKLVQQLDYPLDPSESGGVYVYYVKHGEAKKIADTLNGFVQEADKKTAQAPAADPNNPAAFKPPQQKPQIFGGDIVIKADENTNSLIVTASKQDYQTFQSLMAKIDLPKDQVYVEAYIIDMKATRGFNWGVSGMKFLGADADASKSDNGVARIGYNFADFGKVADIASTGAILGFGSKDNKVSVKLGGQTVLLPNLLAFVNFIQQNTNSNILSTPQVLAMDNEESLLEVGDEVPVGLTQAPGVGGGVGIATPQFKDAVISLKITPFISPDSDILRMHIEQKANDISTKIPKAAQLQATAQGITKRSIKTNLTLQSGDAAVLGGLMQDNDTVEESKVPLLGDIPVLGWLFKSRVVKREKSNLMVFISPTIIRNSEAHKKLVNVKLNDRIKWLKKSANGRDPHGEDFANLTKYAESADEFKLEDQKVSPEGSKDPDAGTLDVE